MLIMKNKFKKIFDYFVCLAAGLCFMSCLNSISAPSDNSVNADILSAENTTVLFKGSINIESSLSKSLLPSKKPFRSASPEAIDMASHEFYVTATSKTGTVLQAEVVEDSVTGEVTFEMPLEFGEWTIETGIRKTSNQQKILIDIFTVKLLEDATRFPLSK